MSIIVWAPGTAPRPEEVDPGVAGPIKDVRGVQSREVSGSTMIWMGNGITVTIHSNGESRQKILEALRSANAGPSGHQPVNPGQSLAALAR